MVFGFGFHVDGADLLSGFGPEADEVDEMHFQHAVDCSVDDSVGEGEGDVVFGVLEV